MQEDPEWIRKKREVRDVFNHLRKKYKSELVLAFISQQYFIRENTVWRFVRQSDKEPVDRPSLVYKQVFSEGFHL